MRWKRQYRIVKVVQEGILTPLELLLLNISNLHLS